MDNLTDIFEADAVSGEELDAELVAAGQVLGELAKEAGVDLNDLSEQDVADLLLQLRGEDSSGTEQTPSVEQNKEASQMDTQITYADVAAELAKVAQEEGIDIGTVSREEYHAAFDELAEKMQDPGYYETQEKIAEAEEIGRIMARSFVDELEGLDSEKVAATAYDKERMRSKMDAARSKADAYAKRTAGRANNQKSTRVATAAERKRRGQAYGERVKQRIANVNEARGAVKGRLKGLAGAAKGHLTAAGHVMGIGNKRNALRAGAALAGGSALLGAGGLYAATRKKESAEEIFESDALELARNFLLENGIDPDGDTKVAGDEEYEDLVAERAIELLVEAGYEIDPGA